MLSQVSHVRLYATLSTIAHQAPLSMGFSRQEYWSGQPFPFPGDIPNPEIKPTSLTTPALAGRFFTTSATWKPIYNIYYIHLHIHNSFGTRPVSSVTQLCPTLCDPMNHSTPGLPVHHQLPESTQTHVHRVGDAIQPSHPLLSPSPPTLNLSQHQGIFKRVSSSHQVAKVLEFQPQH